MYSLSLNDNSLSFKTLEQEIYRIVCDIACDIFKDALEKIDKMLMATRDVERYRHKGERVIIVMGAVCVIKSRVSGTLNKYISCIA